MNIVFDMETQDPDDMFTLCFLGSHLLLSILIQEEFFQTLTQVQE